MKSKKDQGNAFYKKQKFKQAIECYKQYVSVHNEDNCKAYSNMALSYFRMKQYQNCIWACEKAIELQPQFEKPFYRMFEAYRELKDHYGMMISGSRFCKLSKQEKEIKELMEQLFKVKQELCYNYCSSKIAKTQQEKFIEEVVSLSGNKQTDGIITIKQPLMSRQSKWEKIVLKIKQNKREGLNEGRKFINTECQGQQQKEKYKKMLVQLRNFPVQDGVADGSKVNEGGSELLNADNNVNRNSNNNSESSLQEPRVEELQQYTMQKQKNQKDNQHQQEQKIKHQQQPQTVESPQQPSTEINNDSNPQTIQQTHQQQQQPSNNQSNQQQFVTQQQAQRLFNQYINNNLINSQQDPFTALYSSLIQTLRSIQLDKFQKQAILSLAPTKVKKFSMLMKSYSGKQKQSLHDLFIENNLGNIWQQLYVSKK